MEIERNGSPLENIVSTLNPLWDAGVEKHEGEYQIDIPQVVTDVSREIQNYGGRALLEGGSVHDTVINKELGRNLKPKDFDLEVFGLTLAQVCLILKEKYGSENLELAGESFQVIKLKVPGFHIPLDISVTRRDSKKEGGKGHKDGIIVEGDPTMGIKDAAIRRDLTINTMAFDPLTNILYDPYGGIKDVKNQVIEITDNEHFQDDPIRVMRIMQIASRTGFVISENAIQLCREMVEKGDLDYLFQERIAEEFNKLMGKSGKPSIGLEFARETGFVEKYWPELHALIGVPQEYSEQYPWHPEGDVWNHSLQVADAAMIIADRETIAGRMKEEDRLILVTAGLCHDFGKPQTTKFEEGAIRSKGHEEAGVAPTRTFLERFYHDPIAKNVFEITKKVLPLVAEHLRPKEMWIRGVNQEKTLRKLAYKLKNGSRNYKDGGDITTYMLSMLAEADQRGRSATGKILERDEVQDLDNWQAWFERKCNELKITDKGPVPLLNGDELLQKLRTKKEGPWVGVLVKTVLQDQFDGVVTNSSEALDRALYFYDAFMSKIAKSNVDERQMWLEIKNLEDPRLFLE